LKIRDQLLSKKDIETESFLQDLMEQVASELPEHLTESERNTEMIKKVVGRLHSIGSSLVLKLNPLIKTIVEYKSALQTEGDLATINVPELGVREKSEIYKRMFYNFVSDQECVSYKISNKSDLGNLCHQELFVLTLFVFATCRRTRSDGLLQLFVSGKSSTGKSKLIEFPLLQLAHQTVSSSSGEAGCGRFNLNSKSLIILTDIPVSHLYGHDLEHWKTISRAEPTTVKVHSSTQVLPPCFLLATSNDRLHDHVVRPKNGAGLPRYLTSSVDSKRVRPEHLEALRCRFLEFHVLKACRQDPEDLRNSDLFRRNHLVLGIYDWVMQILVLHAPADFASKHLYHYAVSGLQKNSELYRQTFECSSEDLEKTMLNLKINYNLL